MPRALLSVSDKAGLDELGRGLAERGFDLVSTGGTAAALERAGLTVISVAEVTGVPEMMGGRVKTLHPRIHGGILARRTLADDLEAAAQHGIALIDLVVVNLYPFVKAAANPATSVDALIEEIDIGGPSLVRAAAKNFQHVLVVVSPSDYPALLSEIDRGPSLAFRFELARKAFAHTGQYDAAIAATLGTIEATEATLTRGPASVFPETLATAWHKLGDLRYGENPHQAAAWYASDPPVGLGAATLLQGKELSYTNLLDLDAALRIALEFSEPAAVVIKHTNPCGVATGATSEEAYVRARDADALSAFGGIVGLNRQIDAATAKALTSTFIEAVIAPALDEEARAILAGKQNLRVITTEFSKVFEPVMGEPLSEMRSFLGGMLMQEPDRVVEAHIPWPPSLPDTIRVVTKREPTLQEWTALRFAWRVCAHVKSNTIVFTGTDRTMAVGAGQMSRVDAVNVAVMKAAGKLAGSVAASDAFFPFRDGLDQVAKAGATAVVQPGGSVRDAEVIAAADEHGIAMVFTGRRHFRH